MTGIEQRKILAESNRWLGEQILENGGRWEAMQCLLRSWFNDPGRLDTLKLLVKSCLPIHTLRQIRKAIRGVRAPLAMGNGLQTVKSSGGH